MAQASSAQADVVVIGGGVIGLAIARKLHIRGAIVRVLEKGRAGQEASWAAAGMLAAAQIEADSPLKALSMRSAALYPEFIAKLEDETGQTVDFRPSGTLVVTPGGKCPPAGGRELSVAEVREVEPALVSALSGAARVDFFESDHSVDNRRLVQALLQSLRQREVEVREGSAVLGLSTDQAGRAHVRLADGELQAAHVVLAAGAWSGELISRLPVRPRKGHILSVALSALRHVVVGQGSCYLVPRSDGRTVIGATVEEAGFDKTLEPRAIAMLRSQAAELLPEVGRSATVESWTGLRPGTSDDLPVIGGGPAVWIATGHFRDGILLTPVTAGIIADLIEGKPGSVDLHPFRPERFPS